MAGKTIIALTAASGGDLTNPLFPGMATLGTEARKWTPAQIATSMGITLGSTFTTTPANALTLTTAGATNVTLPTSGTLAILGANTFTGVQTLPNGTAGAPSLNFGDATTGLYRFASNYIGVATNGVVNSLFNAKIFYAGFTPSTEDAGVWVGDGRSGNGNSYLKLVGDATYTDYGLIVQRSNTGANATSLIDHRGTGTLLLRTLEAGSITFSTTGTLRLTIAAAGAATFTSTVDATGYTISGASVVARLDTAQVWTAAQRATITTLTDGANISVNFATSNDFTVTLGGNRTLDNPTNVVAGQSGVITVVQDGTGTRTLAYGTSYKFAGGVIPVLSTAINTVDRLCYYVRNSTFIEVELSKAWA